MGIGPSGPLSLLGVVRQGWLFLHWPFFDLEVSGSHTPEKDQPRLRLWIQRPKSILSGYLGPRYLEVKRCPMVIANPGGCVHLPVDVPADGDRGSDPLDVPLLDKDLPCLQT